MKKIIVTTMVLLILLVSLYPAKAETAKEEIKKGKDSYDSGDYEKALKYYNKALEYEPENIDALRYKGRVLADLNRYEEAIKCYDKITALRPKDGDAWYMKGFLLLHDPVEGRCPEPCPAYFNGYILLKEPGKYEESIKCFDNALKINPEDVKIFMDKAEALCFLEKYKEAVTCYDKAIKIQANDSNEVAGISELRKLALNPASFWLDTGVHMEDNHYYDQALKCFDKGIKLDPDNVEIWSWKGGALYELGKYEEAIKCYDNALSIDPKDSYNNWYSKGVALYKLGRYEDAIKCYDKVLKINPDDARVWESKGDVLSAQKKYREAIECFDKALKIVPDDPDAKAKKEEALKALGK